MIAKRCCVVASIVGVFALLGGASCSDESGPEGEQGGSGGSHGDGSNSAGATAPETLGPFCATLAAFFCDRCEPASSSCASELESACSSAANTRDPGGYTKSKGQACLDALADVDCDSPPQNCQAELALAECNTYLESQTDGVDPACP